MSTLLELVDKYIFAGVPSNAVYDLLKAGWERANQRSWDELYLDAFKAALEQERAQLMRYGDHLALEREDLRRAEHLFQTLLHQAFQGEP